MSINSTLRNTPSNRNYASETIKKRLKHLGETIMIDNNRARFLVKEELTDIIRDIETLIKVSSKTVPFSVVKPVNDGSEVF